MGQDNVGLVLKYFVLDPCKKDAYGRASLKALETYETEIASTNPRLAEDLRMWLARIHAFGEEVTDGQ